MTISLEDYCKIVIKKALDVAAESGALPEEEFKEKWFSTVKEKTGIPRRKISSLKFPFICKLLNGRNGTSPLEYVSYGSDFGTMAFTHAYIRVKENREKYSEEYIQSLVICLLSSYGDSLRRKINTKEFKELISVD
ncbi:MAG: hypothetical protein KKF68_01195 [Nanoarchaeota archaeon]|nr:hypothetical protein [Nanoarchaeota archaeon]